MGEKYVQEPRTLGDYIRNRRLELGLLQREVAEIVGVTEESVYNWEHRRAILSVSHYPSIIAFLGYFPFDTDPYTLAGAIQRYRFTFGLARKRLARLIGVDEATIWSWEIEGRMPLRKHQAKLKGLCIMI